MPTTATQPITEKDRRRAAFCLKCPLCRCARKKQKGLAFWFVRKVEAGLCSKCRAYEKVYARKAHDPLPPEQPAG